MGTGAVLIAISGALAELDLEFLDFREPLPLARDQMVDLLVQVPDFEFGLQVDLIVVEERSRSFAS